MTRGLISIFALPHEIDDLHISLYNLKRNAAMLPHDIAVDLDITLCVSREIMDWDNSLLPRQFFIDKFESFSPLWDWSKNPHVRVELESTILGCVSQRRATLRRADGYDFTIWLDGDMMFNDHALLYLISSYKAARDHGYQNTIITPQFVRQWDASWDALVNEQFLQKPLMYHESADIISDTLYTYEDIQLVPLSTFKFAGGWGTLLSNSLLNLIGIPDALGHYGLEDTFIVEACKLLRQHNHASNPQQFSVKGLVAGENYIYRATNPYLPYMQSRNRKSEFREVAAQHFNTCLQDFSRRVLL
jgi:hypothetical protein